MADPRLEPDPQKRKAMLSPLMHALLANKEGNTINFCPFGCEDEQLDDNGYCRHLIGFTNDKKSFEPMVKRHGRRVVQVKRPRILAGVDEEGVKEYHEGPPELEPCLKGDKFVQITTSWRVYRDVDASAQTKTPDKGVKQTA